MDITNMHLVFPTCVEVEQILKFGLFCMINISRFLTNDGGDESRKLLKY